MVNTSIWRKLGLPALVALALLCVILVLFVVAALSYHTDSAPVGTLTSGAYMDTVTALLANADPSRGVALTIQYQCVVCHVTGADNIAPSYAGLGARAATRRPPLAAAAYIYESIVHPMAYVVPGYAPVMPGNFAARIPDRDLGDLIAYLMTQ